MFLTNGGASLVLTASGIPQMNVREVNFVWDYVPDATSYVLQVGVSSGVYTTLDTDVGNVLYYRALLVPGTYYSRVVPQGAGSATSEEVLTI